MSMFPPFFLHRLSSDVRQIRESPANCAGAYVVEISGTLMKARQLVASAGLVVHETHQAVDKKFEPFCRVYCSYPSQVTEAVERSRLIIAGLVDDLPPAPRTIYPQYEEHDHDPAA